MNRKNGLAMLPAFILVGTLAGRGFAKSDALDQLKAQAESLNAATPVPAQSPVSAPAESRGAAAPIPARPPAPAQEANAPAPIMDLRQRIDAEIVHLFYAALPHLEPKGSHYLEIALSRATVEYIKTFDGNKCPLDQPLANFHELAPGVYRSGFPTQEGFAQLKQKGFKTVLSLLQASETQKPEEPTVADFGMSYANVPVDWTLWPSFQQLDQAVEIMTDPSKQPVLIHCNCGKDRTGVFSAAYRVAAQGWTPERAADEAKALYWHVPAGDLVEFLAGYARYRAGKA